jgi:8-oxo-dGTP pyrophosphatase MutT (NUDIX family)
MAQQIFSAIQNHILSKLKNAKSLRYSELQPVKGDPVCADFKSGKVPNDLFNYHLQFLVKKGFLEKISGEKGGKKGDADAGYTLSKIGLKYVADPFLPSDKPEITSLFKVNVLTVVSRKIGGRIQILNQLRTSQPSYGKIGVPGGVVRKTEFIEEAASRKLKIETGLEAQFRLVGMQRRIMYKDGELFSDVYFPIAYAHDDGSGKPGTGITGELVDTEYGKNMWVDIDEAIANEERDSYDSLEKLPTILRAIRDGSIDTMPFLFDENVRVG